MSSGRGEPSPPPPVRELGVLVPRSDLGLKLSAHGQRFAAEMRTIRLPNVGIIVVGVIFLPIAH